MTAFSGSIQLLLRTSSQWSMAPDNAVQLKSGQVGLELLGTGKYRAKIGNAVDVWSALPYLEAATFQEVLDLITDLQEKDFWKPNVVAAAPGNITPLINNFPIDGYAVQRGDFVFLPYQTNPEENGPWKVTSGAWTRPTWFDDDLKHMSMSKIRVSYGDTNAGKEFMLVTPPPITLGTDALTFIETTPQTLGECVIDISGLTVIDLTGNKFCGIITLTSSNPAETINNIIYNGNAEIEFRPNKPAGLVVTFNDKSVAAGNIHLDTVTKVVDGNDFGFIRLKPRGGEFFQVACIENYN